MVWKFQNTQQNDSKAEKKIIKETTKYLELKDNEKLYMKTFEL